MRQKFAERKKPGCGHLFTTHLLDHGMYIHGRDVSIDVVCRRVSGSRFDKKVELEVRAEGMRTTVFLCERDGMISIADEVLMGIDGPGDDFEEGIQIDMEYIASREYHLEQMKYPL
ncbi:hypothetical protein GF351_03865 [Candidatus Woesearchaeota archaeon]|nr:hypothetical protein [Candidatus Woesearchaeota archaeon]